MKFLPSVMFFIFTTNSPIAKDMSTKSSPSHDQVTVLACGYKYVTIAKSGLRFPAWLVRIRENQNDEASSHRVVVWRSKRDFWRLARHWNGFPKAAWNKLCDAAPWKRPDFLFYLNATHNINQDLQGLFDETENKWEPFMKKSLLKLDQYLGEVALRAAKKDDSALQEAWKNFVRGAADEEEVGTSAKLVASAARIGNAFGQYFCHPDNARQLVHVALSRLQSILAHRPQDKLLFLEPSCGHGQIIETLLQELQSPESPFQASKYQVRGIDIDETAIQQCREKFSDNMVALSNNNFLESSLDDFSGWTDDCLVVVIGGPPYTAGAGRGTSDDASLCRDLPMQFVRHSFSSLRASIVCFLMPARCARVDYVKDGWIPEQYTAETIQLDAPSTFFFQGSDPVTQPSVLQCFRRVEQLQVNT